MPSTSQRNKGPKISILNNMCKKNTVDGDMNDNTNIGLLNVSSESFGQSLNAELVIDLVVLMVLLMLLMRWVKKCFVKRKLKQRRALTALLHGGQGAGHAPPPQHAQPPPPLPVLAPPLPAAPAPAQLMIPMGARAMPALEYRCAEPKEVWTQA